MLNIGSIVGQTAEWTQPDVYKRDYALVSDGQEVATLRFQSAAGSLATAESADGCWTLKRMGFWQARVTVRACGSEDNIGVFTNDTWSAGGTLELGAGRSFLFSTNFWQTRMAVTDPSGAELVVFNTEGLAHFGSKIEVTPQGAACPELPLLILVGWYLIAMMYLDMFLIAIS
ncbi:MAG TPA: hypothetical protein VFS21_36975 [Roseiflexaceae bacterium]|nr:hypothetical protein [Roseiflexaceae bacterium]